MGMVYGWLLGREQIVSLILSPIRQRPNHGWEFHLHQLYSELYPTVFLSEMEHGWQPGTEPMESRIQPKHRRHAIVG